MKQYLRGSSIIEVLIAATLISISIIAALSLSSFSQKQTDFSRDLNKATFYNTQSIDWLRNMRTMLGWGSFVNELDLDTAGSTLLYCLNSLPTTVAQYAALTPSAGCDTAYITGTPFQREMKFTLVGSPVTSVSVSVTTYWQLRARSTTTETTLTEW